MKRYYFFLAIFFFISPQADAQLTTLNVFRDGYVEDYEPSGTLDGVPDRISDTNALLAGKLVVGSGAAIDSRAIMTFDIDPFINKQLDSAYLTAFGRRVDNKGSTDSIDAELYNYQGNGLVDLADFDVPGLFVDTLTFTPKPDTDISLDFYKVDVQYTLQHLLDDQAQYAEFRLQSNEATAFLNAGESPFVDNRWPGPQLELTFASIGTQPVPEPETYLLLGLGFLGLVYFRQRQKA